MTNELTASPSVSLHEYVYIITPRNIVGGGFGLFRQQAVQAIHSGV